jgi:3-oxoadipate enol-lactonase
VSWCVANGVSLYYELDELAGTGTGGARDRLLCISGTGGDLRTQPRLTDGPADAFQLLLYDQRGLGQSSLPAEPSAMADFADDAAALLDAVGWDDCLVVGVSFGGMVAQELTLRHSRRVRRLVLACTSAGGLGGASYPLRELVKLDDDARAALQMELLDTRWDGAWRAAHPEQVALIASRMPSEAGEHGAGSPGLANQLAARARHDTAARLGSIGCPTLVCGGRFDGLAPPANSEFLAGAIPGARLTLFDGGHLFLLQDGTAMPAIIEFLGAGAQGAAGP